LGKPSVGGNKRRGGREGDLMYTFTEEINVDLKSRLDKAMGGKTLWCTPEI